MSIEQNFPAVLMTLDDKVMEYGTASVSVEEGSIDFKSSFVPIFKMGTSLKIVRTKDELETQIFIGEVYLSSERMLRLVSVTDEVLPAAASAYTYDTLLKGNATAMVSEAGAKRFFLKPKTAAGPKSKKVFPIIVHAISLSQVKFTCDINSLEQGQELTISVSQPILLDKLPLEIELPVSFGEDSTCNYRCRILKLDGVNRSSLESYVQQLSMRTNKMFPPISTSSDAANP